MADVAPRYAPGPRSHRTPHHNERTVIDVPDQAAIVRQYMRHTTQIMSGRNVSKTVMRALQLYARSFLEP